MTDKVSLSGNRLPKPEDLRLEIEDWIAECQSLQPDLSIGIRSIGTSWDALCLIYILTHVASLWWITEDVLRRIAQKAYVANYEGEWETVQVFLEQNPQTPEEFYNLFLKYRSPEEFFGNLKKHAKRIQLILRFKKRDPHGPVRQVQRKRGYRDKGTYRPPHEFHGDPPEKAEKIDRRKLVGHPLIREETKNQWDDSIISLEVKEKDDV